MSGSFFLKLLKSDKKTDISSDKVYGRSDKMRITSNMISRGMEDLEKNPFYKKKVEESKTDETKKEDKNKMVALSKNVVAEQVKDTVVLSKIGPNGHIEQLKTVAANSEFGRQLSGMIKKENMSEEDVLKEKIEEITLNSKRLSLANYL